MAKLIARTREHATAPILSEKAAFYARPLNRAIVLNVWRWEIAFHEGRTSVDTHPALPEDRTRYDEIKQELNKRLVMDESQAICAKATFQAIEQVKSEPGWKPLIAEWREDSCQDAVDNRLNVKW